jgi:hypothetical protein
MGYTPNVLNQFATYSYRIRIYMLREIEADYSNYKSGILIADTASIAQYNIQSIEQVHYLSHSLARNAFANRFNMVISEPNGASFFQFLANSSYEMGVKNWASNAKYVIEISFPGRKEDNSISSGGLFVIPVRFITVTSNINSTGSLYNIGAVEISTNAHSSELGVLKSTVVSNGKTIGEVVSDFERLLNESEEASLLTNRNASRRNRYKIEFDENISEWRNWTIEFDEEKPGPDDVIDQRQFPFYAGSNIQELFTSILTNTKEYKNYPVVTGGYSTNDSESPPSNLDLKVLFKVIATEVDREFDPVSGRYAKDITYRIKKYITPELIVNAEEVLEYKNDTSIQNKRVSNLLGLGLMKKRYDYLYTGQNTEIINLDIKLEHTFYMVSPTMGGQVSTARSSNNLQPIANIVNAENKPNINIQEVRRAAAETQNRILSGEETNPFILGTIRQLDRTYINQLSQAYTNNSGMSLTYVNDGSEQTDINTPKNDTTTPSVMRFGASLQNLYNSGDMLEIEMTIRGDPYWLGNPNSLYKLNSEIASADYELGSHYFYLKINLPSETGPSSDYMITGVYKVVSVISEFRNGKFVQFLKAYRDNLVNIPDVLSVVESGEGVAPNLSPNAPLDGSSTRSPTSGNSNISSSRDNRPDNRSGDRVTNEDDGPNIPTNAEVAETATEPGAVDPDTGKRLVIGTSGTTNNSRALVRESDGSIITVTPGSTIGNRTITGITTDPSTGIGSITFDNGNSASVGDNF